ncbi:MAG: protein kinase [Myxococcales bacterium]|nr:protein kinase [Myxococcales bacterium]
MLPGTVLRDKYELVASIGRGGMGEVFHAVHLPSGTDVAVKVVNREIVDDTMMARLEREAAAATRIQSPYVPRLLDVDRLESGELFLVMELLTGETLSERLKRGGVLSWEEVYHIGDNVLRGLIDAHDAGVVHRDLKPGNIFIEHLDGGLARARILDFCVCKLDEHDPKKLTVTGESVGTIAYMAPEQIRGASKVDERADLYSFAMIVYEAVCGRIPYEAQGQMALLAVKLERPARAMKGLNLVPVPSGLDSLLVKALSRRPTERPANGREMLRAWQGLGGATSQPVVPVPPAVPTSPSSPPTQVVVTSGATPSMPPEEDRPRRPYLAIGAGVALAGLILVTALSRRGSAQVAEDVPAAEAKPAALAPESPSAPEPAAPLPVQTGPVAAPSAPMAPTTAPVAPFVEVAPVAPPVAPSSQPVEARPPQVTPSVEVELDERNARRGPKTPATPRPTPAAPPLKTAPEIRASAKPPTPPPVSTPPKGKGPTLVEQPRY